MQAALQGLTDTGAPVTARELVGRLALRDRPAGDRPHVVAAMIASVDGRAAVQGRSVALGHPEDRALLRELRTGVDAILVGAATLRAERYRTLLDPDQREHRVAAGLAAHPVVATISRRLDLRAADVPLFEEPDVTIAVYAERDGDVGEAAADVRVHDLGEGGARVRAVLEHLAAEYGARAVLCEGGPSLLREVVAARCLDDLLVTISPLAAGGDAPRVLEGAALDPPVGLDLVDVLRADSHVFLHYRPAP